MDRAARRAAKTQLVTEMLHGSSWQEAARSAGLQTSRTTAYRLLHRVRTEGAVALDDQRHGHPAKLRKPVQQWLVPFCRAAPASSGRTVQVSLFEQFGLEVRISQINRLRAALGVRRSVPGVGKNQPPGPDKESEWAQGARGLLMMATAQETGLLAALEEALPTSDQTSLRLAHATTKTHRQALLTLLFLPAVGLRRPYDLRASSGDAL